MTSPIASLAVSKIVHVDGRRTQTAATTAEGTVAVLLCLSVCLSAPCGAGAPLFPLVHLLHLFRFHFSLSFIGFTYILLLSIPSLSTRIFPLRFQAGGRRRRPNLGLVCVLFCTLRYLYSLVKIWIVVFCSIWFSVPSVL